MGREEDGEEGDGALIRISGSRRSRGGARIPAIVLGLVLVAVVVFVIAERAQPVRWDPIHEIHLVADRHDAEGRPTNAPSAGRWIIGDDPPTEEAVVHTLRFRGTEPGWVPVPDELQDFGPLVEALTDGGAVTDYRGEPIREDLQAAFLSVWTEIEEFSVGAWPLVVRRPDGPLEDCIAVVVRRPDGQRVARAIRCADPAEQTFACSFTTGVTQDATGAWAFTQGHPVVTTPDRSGLVGWLIRGGEKSFDATLRIQVFERPTQR